MNPITKSEVFEYVARAKAAGFNVEAFDDIGADIRQASRSELFERLPRHLFMLGKKHAATGSAFNLGLHRLLSALLFTTNDPAPALAFANKMIGSQK